MYGRILQNCSCGEVVQQEAAFLCHPKKHDELLVSRPFGEVQIQLFAALDSFFYKLWWGFGEGADAEDFDLPRAKQVIAR